MHNVISCHTSYTFELFSASTFAVHYGLKWSVAHFSMTPAPLAAGAKMMIRRNLRLNFLAHKLRTCYPHLRSATQQRNWPFSKTWCDWTVPVYNLCFHYPVTHSSSRTSTAPKEGRVSGPRLGFPMKGGSSRKLSGHCCYHIYICIYHIYNIYHIYHIYTHDNMLNILYQIILWFRLSQETSEFMLPCRTSMSAALEIRTCLVSSLAGSCGVRFGETNYGDTIGISWG